jgi:sugar porter (SP) family MFS transporter
MASTATPPATAPGISYNRGYTWLICLVAAMGGLMFGYDWVVIGGAKPFFEAAFNISHDAVVDGVPKIVTNEQLSGWANSCALLGCLLGSMVSGGLSDRFGRKWLLVAAAVLFAVSSILTGWAGGFWQFIAWRILGGVAIGMASNLSPMYIAEVAPAALRGRMVAVNQLTIVFGVLGAQIVNMLIAQKVPDGATVELIRQSWNGISGWRWMFTAVTAPSLAFFLGALWLPESPRWLVKNGRRERALAVLSRVAGRDYAEIELADIQRTISTSETERVRFADLLEPRMMKILLLGVFLAVLQQWSGLNVIFNYAEEIYREAGYGINDIFFNIVLTGAINLVTTLIAIAVVDYFGRRSLMLVGCAGIALSHLFLGGAYYFGLKGIAVLAITLSALGFYGLSLAPIVWVLISEIFPNRIRGAAISVAVSALWVSCFLLTYTFPKLKGAVGMTGAFWIYAAICIVGFFVVLLRVPETKGKTLEQIEKELTD